jgi:hypothetical protein
MAKENAKKEVKRSDFIEFEDRLFDAIDDSGDRAVRVNDVIRDIFYNTDSSNSVRDPRTQTGEPSLFRKR